MSSFISAQQISKINQDQDALDARRLKAGRYAREILDDTRSEIDLLETEERICEEEAARKAQMDQSIESLDPDVQSFVLGTPAPTLPARD